MPKLRALYLGIVREIALKWLDWGRLGPFVETYQSTIDRDVRVDTKKLVSYETFRASAAELRGFASERRAFLIEVTKGDGVAR